MKLVKKLLPLLAVLSLSIITPAYAETPDLTPVAFKLLSAALSFSAAALAAGWAISAAGSASMAAAAERPELVTYGLIITALGEAIGIYGIVMGILILGQAV